MNKNIINIDKSNIETSSVTNDDISKNKQLSLFNESNIILSGTSVSDSVIANNPVFQIKIPELTPTINDFVSLIEKIANLVIDNEDKTAEMPMLVADKIKHNNLYDIEALINDYGLYFDLIDKSKTLLDETNPYAFNRMIAYIRHKYLNIIQREDIDYIRQNATKIWQQMRLEILQEINTESSATYALSYLMCYAFIKCKIFAKISGETL